MNKGMALMVLREKMTDPIAGIDEDEFLPVAIMFLNSVSLEKLTPENILDEYISYLEGIVGASSHRSGG